jgi:enoyl-CoA hydratase
MKNILYSTEAGVGRIIINRPEKSNALNPEVLRQLRQIILGAAANPELRVLTITGSGDRIFCAGIDLKDSLAAETGGDAFGRSDFRQLLLEIVRFPKPTVALARGHAMGGGLGIVLACDLCLACEDVYFSTPEIQVGMFPMMIFGLLHRHVGRKKAKEMMFLGEQVPAPGAMELGLINHAFPREQFDFRAEEFVHKLAEKSATILGMGKAAILHLLDANLHEEEIFLESALGQVMATEDSKEGIRAFVEKRKPHWN